MADVLAAIKAAPPGKFKASGTGQGGIWHLALAGMLSDLKIDPASVPWVPSNGAAPGLQDLVAGGVEFVPCSLPEARSLIDAGKVRSLAVMDDQARRAVPERAHAEGGHRLGLGHRRLARHRRARRACPRTCRRGSKPSVKKAYDSKEYKDFMAQRGFGVLWGNSRGVRQLHGQGRRRHEDGDDGGRHRQVAARSA